MTVQELINKLEKIEDKDKEVVIWAEYSDGWDVYGDYISLDKIIEKDETVIVEQ